MLNPQMVLAMADYLQASEDLADATEDLIAVHAVLPYNGELGACVKFAREAEIRLKVYRQARHNWENLQ